MKLILYNALIKPYMEYGIELWGSAKVKQLKKINKLRAKDSETAGSKYHRFFRNSRF